MIWSKLKLIIPILMMPLLISTIILLNKKSNSYDAPISWYSVKFDSVQSIRIEPVISKVSKVSLTVKDCIEITNKEYMKIIFDEFQNRKWKGKAYGHWGYLKEFRLVVSLKNNEKYSFYVNINMRQPYIGFEGYDDPDQIYSSGLKAMESKSLFHQFNKIFMENNTDWVKSNALCWEKSPQLRYRCGKDELCPCK